MFAPMLLLPEKLLGLLLSKLSARDLSTTSMCCRHFRRLCSNDALWRLLMLDAKQQPSFALLPCCPRIDAPHGWRKAYAICAAGLQATGHIDGSAATSILGVKSSPSPDLTRRRSTTLVAAMQGLLRPLTPRGGSSGTGIGGSSSGSGANKAAVQVLLVGLRRTSKCQLDLLLQIEASARCHSSWAESSSASGGGAATLLAGSKRIYRSQPTAGMDVDELEFDVPAPREASSSSSSSSPHARRALRLHLTSVHLGSDGEPQAAAAALLDPFIGRSQALIWLVENEPGSAQGMQDQRASFYRLLREADLQPKGSSSRTAGAVDDPRDAWPVLVLTSTTPKDGGGGGGSGGGCSAAEVAAAFQPDAHGLAQKLWRVQGYSPSRGAGGLAEGLSWLSSAIQHGPLGLARKEVDVSDHHGRVAETYASGAEAGAYNSEI